MSFQNRITSFKRCFPFNENNLTSLALYLSTGTNTGAAADQSSNYSYSLDKIGFEYGDCRLEEVTGEVRWLELQYTQIRGVQKFSFEDEARTWSFGYEIEGQAKVKKLFEFSDTNRWVGVHGVESSSGIEKIGVITMDPTCTPLDGVLQPIKEDAADGEGSNSEQITTDPNGDQTEVEFGEAVTSTDETGSDGIGAGLIVVIVVLVLAMVVAAVFIFLFVRKTRLNKDINRLQSNVASGVNKPNYDDLKKGVIEQDPV